MGEIVQQTCPSKRDWWLSCFDIAGRVSVSVIDCDHGAVRIGIGVGEREDFFELRGEQVCAFREALRAKPTRWEVRCFDRWGQPSRCLIEATQHGAVRISSGGIGEWECCLELRGEQVRRFQVALGEAIEVFYTDVAEHGHHWADDEDLVVSRGMTESAFTQKVYKMVAAEAPSISALVAEGERGDPVITAWCTSFADGTKVYSAGSDHVCGSFSSVERSQKILSAHGKTKLRVVSVAEERKQPDAEAASEESAV
jgi:hypothetical protein